MDVPRLEGYPAAQVPVEGMGRGRSPDSRRRRRNPSRDRDRVHLRDAHPVHDPRDRDRRLPLRATRPGAERDRLRSEGKKEPEGVGTSKIYNI